MKHNPPKVPPSPPIPLGYAPITGGPVQRRGLAALVLSLAGMLPALLALLAAGSGRYLDPFAALAIIPLWVISMALGAPAAAALTAAARAPRSLRSDLLQPAVVAHLGFWGLLVVSVLVFLSRI